MTPIRRIIPLPSPHAKALQVIACFGTLVALTSAFRYVSSRIRTDMARVFAGKRHPLFFLKPVEQA